MSTASILHGSYNNTINNSKFVIGVEHIAAFERLEKAAAPSAFHSFVGRPQPGKCYPNTRIGLLKGLENWIVGLDPRNDFSRPRWTRHQSIDIPSPEYLPNDEMEQDNGIDTTDQSRMSMSPLEDSSVNELEQDGSVGMSDRFCTSISPPPGPSDDELERDESTSMPDQLRMGISFPEHPSYDKLEQDEGVDAADQQCNLPIVWLRGGAGAGKSAVAQTFAERCEDLGHIVASFFFFSTDPTRNGASRLVATLAYQIARADSEARVHIETVVQRDPHIFNQDFTKQFSSLIINPIHLSAQAQDGDANQRHYVIIIDGLDECIGGATQAGIVRAVSDALQTIGPDVEKTLPHFLICSRPEEPITRIFRSPHLENIHIPIDLSTDPNADDDIRTFLAGKLDEIKATHDRQDLIPDSWPSNNDLSILSYNSSGHFIYAQTVVRLLSNDPRPVITLEAILGLRALPQRVREPFAELDQLYRHILLRAEEKCGLNITRHVLGFVAARFCDSRFHVDAISGFLGLEDGELDILLSAVSSLISVATLDFYHKSFPDFLHDELRAREFYIAADDICAFVWDQCVDIASKVAASLHLEDNILRLAIHCVNRSIYYDLSHSVASDLLVGLTQQRQVTPIYQQGDNFVLDAACWAVNCFRYWLKLTENGDHNDQPVKDASVVMIGILGDLVPLSHPGLPLLICNTVTTHNLSNLLRDSLDSSQLDGLVREFSHMGQTDFARFQKFLEDEEIGECGSTGDRFAEASIFWTTHLTKKASLFLLRDRTIIFSDGTLIINESSRQKMTPFRWRRTQRSVRAQNTNDQHRPPHRRHAILIEVSGLTGYQQKVYYGYRSREVFCCSQYDDHLRAQHFAFVLSCIPTMLAKASKSDAVAALRFKAFPPLAKRFPKLMQRIKQAFEEYAVSHGYDSQYTSHKNTEGLALREDLVPGNEITAPPSVLLEAKPILSHLVVVATSLPSGGKRRRRSAPQSYINDNICAEPGCELTISAKHWSVACCSPDCNLKYHLRCQGLTEVPLSEWFCDEACERDAAARKRLRYRL